MGGRIARLIEGGRKAAPGGPVPWRAPRVESAGRTRSECPVPNSRVVCPVRGSTAVCKPGSSNSPLGSLGGQRSDQKDSQERRQSHPSDARMCDGK
ncbi:hypothetical protein BDV59DRAFT_173813 [Aspergillus ambiguus]|uniref:uncharacterized protein n=1 Tax=Aspergillus ambiguus TaxID=176160 RepID=UPI003CCE15BC